MQMCLEKRARTQPTESMAKLVGGGAGGRVGGGRGRRAPPVRRTPPPHPPPPTPPQLFMINPAYAMLRLVSWAL